ncbi:MAG: pilus assembly FimT family protein [Planctomycetota bacterium]|jgi:Tfp pilus assembly protein PilE
MVRNYTVPSLKRRPFTLLEMMTVVIIAGFIMVGLFGGLEKSVRGSNVDYGARMVSTKMQLARMHAVSTREYVAVVVDSEKLTNKSANPNNKIRTCIVDSSNAFQKWVPNTQWTYLPTGITVASLSNGAGAAVDIEVTGVDDDVAFASATDYKLAAVVFKSTGSLIGANDITIRVEPIAGGASSGANNTTYRELAVRWLTGKAEYTF